MFWYGVLVSVLATVPQGVRDSLIDLQKAYRAFTSVEVLAEAPPDKHDGPGSHIYDMVTAQDGRFATKYFMFERPVPGHKWNEQPDYFVFYDGSALHVAHINGTIYEDAPVGSNGVTPPGLVQYVYAPWPVVPMLAQWLLDDDKTVYEDMHGTLTARNDRIGISISWTHDMALTQVLRGSQASGVTQTVEFSEFKPGGIVPIPGRAHELIKTGVVRDGRPVGTDTLYRIASFRINPVDAEALLSFTPLAAGMNRYDRATKNVLAPDGTVLYNEDAGPGSARAWSTGSPVFWLCCASGAGAAALIVVGIRRWRRRRRGEEESQPRDCQPS